MKLAAFVFLGSVTFTSPKQWIVFSSSATI